MGHDAVHTACTTGDDQELRRCIEGLDADRDGLFDRRDPQPRVVVGRPPGSHGRYNTPTPAAVRGSLGDTPLHKAAMAGQSVCVGYLLSVAASGGLTVPTHGGRAIFPWDAPMGQPAGLDGDADYRARVIEAGLAAADPGDEVVAAAHPPPAQADGRLQDGGDREQQPDADGMHVLAQLVSARNDAGQTPLHLAALHGNYTCVQMLLAAKSDVAATDGVTGMTPLHAAVRRGHMRCVMLLLDGSADPNAPDLQGNTALHTAARFDVAGAVRILAGAGGMLDGQRAQDLYTALHLSCRYNSSTDTVLALLDARADPTLVSRGGQPPALVAAALGDALVLEVVSEAHWRLCLENPDGEGLSRIKGGGNLTVRAVFDKAMQRLCWAATRPGGAAATAAGAQKHYDAEFSRVHKWKSADGALAYEIPAHLPGIPSGKWVASGPVPEQALEEAIQAASAECRALLSDKVGSFTPEDKVEELATAELSAPTRTMRTANNECWSGRRAREAFAFSEAAVAFRRAAKNFAGDWWGASGAEAAGLLASEMAALDRLKTETDEKMDRGDRCRRQFLFAEAIEAYEGCRGAFGSYGHADRAFEAACRLDEVRRKAQLKQEAEQCEADAKQQCLAATPIDEYPHSRLMLVEAVANLKRACRIYKGYGDAHSLAAGKSRLTAAQWNLDKQSKAYAHLARANALMSWVELGAAYERKPDLQTVYSLSGEYECTCGAGAGRDTQRLMMLQIGEAIEEYRGSIQYLSDIGDKEVHAMAAGNQREAERLWVLQKDAHHSLQRGQELEQDFCVDQTMHGSLLVFGQTPSTADQAALCIAGRQPYRRHLANWDSDYPLSDDKHGKGTIYHRKMVKESMEAFRHAKECFAQLPDETNRAEAERLELRMLDRLRLQVVQAHAHTHHARTHAHARTRTHASAHPHPHTHPHTHAHVCASTVRMCVLVRHVCAGTTRASCARSQADTGRGKPHSSHILEHGCPSNMHMHVCACLHRRRPTALSAMRTRVCCDDSTQTRRRSSTGRHSAWAVSATPCMRST